MDTTGHDLIDEPERSGLPGLPPERIGRYPVLGELGRGGMGIVYLAEDPTLERQIAIKLLPGGLARSPERWERFSQEARLIAAVQHPRIATVFSLEEAEDVRFLTMELLAGESLAAKLGREGAIGIHESLRISEDIALALAAAHEAGVVHRDLKPQNIQILPSGRVKVFDFGIAASSDVSPEEPGSGDADVGRTPSSGRPGSLRGASRSDASRSGEPMAGTPGYMSPERIRAGEVSPKEDLWSFGCVLFECLSGAAPFLKASLGDTVRATIDAPPPWDRLPAETPERVRDLLSRCLAKDPRARSVSAVDAAAVLRRELSDRADSLRFRPGRDEDSSGDHLPTLPGRFIGRAREMAELGARLEDHRLVTVTAVGGGGKTRLAIETGRELSRRYDLGSRFVDLVALSDASLLDRAMATALGFDAMEEEVFEKVCESIGGRSVLVVLDNCEHLLEVCRDRAERLLDRCPHLRILATSRRPLGAAGEEVYPLASLEVPDPRGATLESIAHVETVRLFLDRAARATSGFEIADGEAEDLAELCVALEGMPLAIELAASRARMLSVSQIRERLTDRLQVLARGPSGDVRHRSVRAALDWSHEQLGSEEQMLLRRLAVFEGGCSLEAAEAVCVDEGVGKEDVLDLLAELVDVSLVGAETSGPASGSDSVRYRLLETVRQYALEKLSAAGEEEPLRDRHRDHFLELATECRSRFGGPEAKSALRRIEVDHENLLSAVRWCTRVPTDPAIAFPLADAMGVFWHVRGYHATGRVALDDLLAAPHLQEESELRSVVLGGAGALATHRGDYTAAKERYEAVRRISDRTGDRTGSARSLHGLAICAFYLSDLDEARGLWEESLAIARELDNKLSCALTLNSLGVVAAQMHDDEAAREFYGESLAIKRELGNQLAVAVTLANLGQVVARSDRVAARSYLEESIEISGGLGDEGAQAFALRQLGNVHRMEGDLGAAREKYEQAHELVHRIGERQSEAESFRNLSALSLDEGEPSRALEHAQSGLRIAAELGDRHESVSALVHVGFSLHDLEELLRAARILGGAEAVQSTMDSRLLVDSRSLTARLEAKLRDLAGREGATDAWERERLAGKAMDLDAVVAYALRVTPGGR